MNEIADALREQAVEVSVPLEKPEIEDIVEVEEQILIGLPAEMREFLMEVSDIVFGSIEPVTVMDPQSHTYLVEVTATAWDLGLPRHLIPICQVGEAYYCIENDGEISFWDNGEFSEDSWDSIWNWAEYVWLNS